MEDSPLLNLLLLRLLLIMGSSAVALIRLISEACWYYSGPLTYTFHVLGLWEAGLPLLDLLPLLSWAPPLSEPSSVTLCI